MRIGLKEWTDDAVARCERRMLSRDNLCDFDAIEDADGYVDALIGKSIPETDALRAMSKEDLFDWLDPGVVPTGEYAIEPDPYKPFAQNLAEFYGSDYCYQYARDVLYSALTARGKKWWYFERDAFLRRAYLKRGRGFGVTEKGRTYMAQSLSDAVREARESLYASGYDGTEVVYMDDAADRYASEILNSSSARVPRGLWI